MAGNWFSVIVELLGGRDEELWPYSGRIFAVGPSHTFTDLADAIDDGFARWDRAHLSIFTLTDGRVITDEQTGIDVDSEPERWLFFDTTGSREAWRDMADSPRGSQTRACVSGWSGPSRARGPSADR